MICSQKLLFPWHKLTLGEETIQRKVSLRLSKNSLSSAKSLVGIRRNELGVSGCESEQKRNGSIKHRKCPQIENGHILQLCWDVRQMWTWNVWAKFHAALGEWRRGLGLIITSRSRRSCWTIWCLGRLVCMSLSSRICITYYWLVNAAGVGELKRCSRKRFWELSSCR